MSQVSKKYYPTPPRSLTASLPLKSYIPNRKESSSNHHGFQGRFVKLRGCGTHLSKAGTVTTWERFSIHTWRMGSQDERIRGFHGPMVMLVSPLRIGQRGTPSKWPFTSWLIDRGDPITTYPSTGSPSSK